MLLTEEQAREKWCPMARVEIDGGHLVNKLDKKWDPLCIASDCMMWRWGEPVLDGKNARQGYCGLAGGWHAHE